MLGLQNNDFYWTEKQSLLSIGAVQDQEIYEGWSVSNSLWSKKNQQLSIAPF